MSDTTDVLDATADLAEKASLLPGPLGVAGGVATMALRAASAIAKAGKDPVAEIARMLRASPEVAEVHSGWDALIERTFRGSTPPTAGDGDDVYGDIDGKKENQPP